MTRMIILGDSITVGTYTSETESSPCSVASPNFAEHLQKMLGYDTLINYGKNGVSVSTASPVFSEYVLSVRYPSMESADFVVIAAGTNDFGTNVPIGSPTDRSTDTFFGALDTLYRGLSKKYRHATIVVITPIHRKDEQSNTLGLPLQSYCDAIRQVADRYRLCVFNGFEIPINATLESHRRLYIKDGVHPNLIGHRIYAEHIHREIVRSRTIRSKT